MTKIKKNDIIAHMMMSENMSFEDANHFIQNFCNYIKTEVIAGNRVYLYEFGIFNITQHRSRTGYNPSTGQPMKLPQHAVIKFKPSVNFKAALKEIHPDGQR